MTEKSAGNKTKQNFLEIFCSHYHLTLDQEISCGWSADKKYLVKDPGGEKFLLRVSHASEKYPYKQQEFLALKMLEKYDLPLPKPISLTYYKDNEATCMLLPWVPGEALGDRLSKLSPMDQYRLGITAGKILRQLHTIPAPDNIAQWEERFTKKIDRRLKEYTSCSFCLPFSTEILTYITANRHLIHNRPQYFQHGDYHVGNMVLDKNGTLGIIDFDRADYGDPWEEFNRITWCAAASKYFAAGRIDGYFNGDIPKNFWKLCLLYICSDMTGAAAAAVSLGEKETAVVAQTVRDVFSWFEDLDNPIPNWYPCNLNQMSESYHL